MTWTAPSSRSFARLKKKTANRYRKGKKTQPPAKNAYRFNLRPPQQCPRLRCGGPERLISSAIVPVSLQATQADVARAYNRSITHPAHLLRACSFFFTSVQSRVKLRTPRFLIPRGRKRLAGGSRPPSTGERRGDQILSP